MGTTMQKKLIKIFLYIGDSRTYLSQIRWFPRDRCSIHYTQDMRLVFKIVPVPVIHHKSFSKITSTNRIFRNKYSKNKYFEKC